MTRSARQLLDLARDWLKQGNTTVALSLLQDASDNAENDPLIKGEIAKEFGRIYMQTGQWDRAEEACRQASSIFLEQVHYRGAAEATRNLANIKFQLGRFDESLSLCDQAIDWATKSGDFQLRATILNTQAAIKSIEGDHHAAIKVFKLCYSDFQRAGNSLRQAYIMHNIGLANTEIGNYEDARLAFEQALHLALENKDTSLVQLCYQNDAKLHLKIGDLIAARSLIKTARSLLDTIKSPYVAADLAMIEAESYKLSGEMPIASEILDNALTLARENSLLQHEGEILYESAQIAIAMGNNEQARSRLEAAITLFNKTGGAKLEKAVEKLKNLENSAKKAIRV